MSKVNGDTQIPIILSLEEIAFTSSVVTQFVAGAEKYHEKEAYDKGMKLLIKFLLNSGATDEQAHEVIQASLTFLREGGEI